MSQTATPIGHPLRADPHIMRTLDVSRAGTIGRPRTLSMEWSFGSDWSQSMAITGLVDVASLLLDSEPAAVYALATELEPPIIKINLLVVDGGIASLEAAWEAPGIPTQRNLHLIGTEGEILHQVDLDNVLWGDNSGPIRAPDTLAALRALSGGVGDGEAARNEAISQALAQSLTSGEMVRIAGEESRS